MAHTIVKRVGGKTKLRKWISGLLPAHTIYVEPFGGSFAIGFALPKTNKSKYRKVYNDLDGHVVNFFRVLRDQPEELISKIELTPYSREEFEDAVSYIDNEDKPWENDNPVEWARRYLIFNRQSMFGKETGSWCISLHGENISMTWATLPDSIRETAILFKEAYVERLDYRKVLKKWDSPEACFYLDPPYLDVEKDFYHVNKNEGFDHVAMRDAVSDIKGSWAISYYDSPEIRDLYKDLDCKFYCKTVKKHMQTADKKDSEIEILIVHYSDWSKEKSDNELEFDSYI